MKRLLGILASALCILGPLTGRALAANCSPSLFIQAAVYPTGGNAEAVTTGDFNGDGLPDLVVAQGNDQSVAVLLNNGDGTFGDPIVTHGNTDGNVILAADLRGNGTTDVIVSAYDSIAVLLGHGDGTFDAAVTYPAGLYNISSLVLGKFDGNDTWDVAVGSFYSNPITVLPGNGNGTFGASIPTSSVPSVSSLAAGHFDSDGNLDLVASLRDGGSVYVFLGHGDGTFANPESFIAGSGLQGVAVADLNADTHDDIAVVSNDTVAVLLGDGNGGFQAALQYPAGITGGGLVVADFNQDGHLDAAVSGPSSFYGSGQEVSILLGRASGGLAPGEPYFAGRSSSLASADFNGDSLPDLVTVGQGSNSAYVLLDTPSGTLVAVPDSRVPMSGPQSPSIAVGDWNADGRDDFAWASNGSIAVGYTDDRGRFSLLNPLPTDPNNPTAYGVATADFDEDGRPDLVASTWGSVLFYRRNDFYWDDPVPILSNSYQLTAIQVGDFNEDGHADVVVAQGCCGSGVLLTLLGNGDGTFQAPVQSPLPNDAYQIVVTFFGGVLDGDLAVSGYGGVWLMKGNGDGTFYLAQTIDTAGTASIAAGGFGNAPNLLVSDGTGHVSIYQYGVPYPELVALPAAGGSLAVGDYNGDGFADFAVYVGYENLVFLGLGSGQFQSPIELLSLNPSPAFLATADLTGNGADDLALLGQGVIQAYINSRISTLARGVGDVAVGGSIVLKAGASGWGDISYHWRKNGIDLVDGGTVSGSSTNELTIFPAGFGDAGSYDVVVADSCASATSNSIAISVEFLDVPVSSPFHDDIIKIATAGITGGCGGGNYCPTSPVSREQMAVFLLKSEHGSGYTPPACTGVFADVPCPSPFADWVEQLATEGVTGGCGGGNYCPAGSVTRAQMAVFLLKTSQGSGYAPPPATGIFGDVPVGSFAADFIEDLYNRGITGGCSASPLLYCPGSSVSRQQMATFIVRTFGL